MQIGESLALVLVLLLSLYGCAALIQRLCLWFAGCPGCAVCCRIAIPHKGAELAPLVRCLQSQTIWDEPSRCRCTLLLMPSECDEFEEKIFCDAPGVIPVTPQQLTMMLEWVAQEN